MYHTQEKQEKQLSFPVLCKRNDAWLGKGYYFWYDEEDAVQWGVKSKTSTGKYEIYQSRVHGENFLDTAYNEQERKFYTAQIEKVAAVFFNKNGYKPNVRYICSYLNSAANWKSELDGIIFDDFPMGDTSMVRGYPYKKRTQAAVYNRYSIDGFTFYKEGDCII